MRSLAFLDFPAIEFFALHLDVFPRPPQTEVMQMILRLNGCPLEAGRGAQWVEEGATRKFLAA